MAIEINDLSGQARACGTLAELYQLTGKATQAHEYYKKVIKINIMYKSLISICSW